MPLELVGATPLTPSGDSPRQQEAKLIGATLRCIARWGIAKTCFEDVAREAGCSRATVYRTFPGGKDALLAAVLTSEVERIYGHLAACMARAANLDELVIGGLVEAAQLAADHDALQFLIRHEPEVVLPKLAFGEMDRFLHVATEFVAPFLGRFLPATDAAQAAEWLTRVFLSYALNPADGIDLADEQDARRLAEQFVLPGLTMTRRSP